MGKTLNQNLLVFTKFIDGQFVKMVTQLLLSLSVFSFLFSQSSLLSLIHSLNFCLSTFPYQLFTHTIDKNCMFILCNGLLVFLAKYSGLIRSSQVDELEPKEMVIDVYQSDQVPRLPQFKGLSVLEKEVGVESDLVGYEDNVAVEEGVNEKEIELMEKVIIEDKECEQGSEFKVSKEDEHEDEEEEKAIVHEDMYDEEEEEVVVVEEDLDWSNEFEEEYEADEEEEEEDEIRNKNISVEEMDKKFDEFIRRMKEGLRIEAQRQLIMV